MLIHGGKENEMDDKYFGYEKEDWERWQTEHREWQESLEGLAFVPLWCAPGADTA